MIEFSFQALFNSILGLLIVIFGYTHRKIGEGNKEIKDDLKDLGKKVDSVVLVAHMSPSETQVTDMVDKRFNELKQDMKDKDAVINTKLDSIEGLFRAELIKKARGKDAL